METSQMSDANAAATAALGDPVTANLAAAFAAQSAAAETETTDTSLEEVPGIDPPPAEEAAEVDPPEDADPAEQPAGDAPEQENDESDDEELSFLSVDELKAKFPRNSSNELIATAAKYSELAKKGHEIEVKLGGEPFIEPLAKMSTAIQESETDPNALQGLFTGIIEAGSAETLVKVLGQAIYMGFVQGPEWSSKPETADFGSELVRLTDAALELRFGAPSDKIAKMAEWAKVGWFDKLEEWVANNYVPQAELDEMIEIQSNPTLRRLAEENQSLKKTQQPAKDESLVASEEADDGTFGNYISEKLATALPDVVWKNSPLQEAKTDTDEIKQIKQFLRETLVRDAQEEFQRSPAYAKLRSGYRSGKADTATYRTQLIQAISAATTSVKPKTATAEKMLAKMFGQTRNARLPQANAHTPEATGDAPKAVPTVPTDFKPANTEQKSVAQVQKNLEEAFANAMG